MSTQRYSVIAADLTTLRTDSLYDAIDAATGCFDSPETKDLGWVGMDVVHIHDADFPAFARLITGYGLGDLRQLARRGEFVTDPAIRAGLNLGPEWRIRRITDDWADLRAGDLISTEFGGLGLIFIHRPIMGIYDV